MGKSVLTAADYGKQIMNPSQKGTINSYQSARYKIWFSNFPEYGTQGEGAKKLSHADLQIFTLYYHELTMPDMTAPLEQIPYNGGIKRSFPKSYYKDDWPNVSITFFANETLENYARVFMWMMYNRIGITMDGEDDLHHSVIHKMALKLLDNQNRDIEVMSMTDLQITRVSALTLAQGQKNASQFTVQLDPQTITMAGLTIEKTSFLDDHPAGKPLPSA